MKTHNFVLCFLLVTATINARAVELVRERGGETIMVPVSLDGKSRLLHLDTGMNRTTLVPETQVSAYPSAGPTRIVGFTGQPKPCDLINAGTVGLGPISRPHFEFRRCDLGPHGYDSLGIDFFAGQLFELDFTGNRLEFLATMPERLETHALVRFPKGYLKITGAFAGREVPMIFDTGWEHYSGVDTAYVAAHPNDFVEIGKQEYYDATNRLVSLPVYRGPTITIGSLVIKDPEFVALDFAGYRNFIWEQPGDPTPFVLGTLIITQGHWFFDLQNDRWAAEPQSAR